MSDEDSTTQALLRNPVVSITVNVMKSMLSLWMGAGLIEIFNFVTSSLFCMVLMVAARKFLVRVSKSSRQTATYIDDVLALSLLLLLSPTNFWELDVHSVMDVLVASLCAARISFHPDAEQAAVFAVCFKFFVSLRVMFSLSYHIDSILLECANLLKVEDLQNRGLFYLKTATRGSVWLLGTMYILHACFNVDLSGLFAGLGVGGLALGLALQSTLKDFFASASIFLDRPFQVDDWVNINGIVGQVRWVGLRSTKVRIKDSTIGGHMLTVPNSELCTRPVINYTEHNVSFDEPADSDDPNTRRSSGSSWNKGELVRSTGGDIYVRLGTPVRKLRRAKEIMTQALESTEYVNKLWVNIANIEREGVLFTLRYDIEATDLQRFRDAKEEIHLKILEGLEKEGIPLVGPVQAVNVIAEAADPFARHTKEGTH